jgi:hypothetical protein
VAHAQHLPTVLELRTACIIFQCILTDNRLKFCLNNERGTKKLFALQEAGNHKVTHTQLLQTFLKPQTAYIVIP